MNIKEEMAIVDAATDGPWEWNASGELQSDDWGVLWAETEESEPFIDARKPDVRFIAHFNPARVLEMLKREKALEDQLKRCNRALARSNAAVYDLEHDQKLKRSVMLAAREVCRDTSEFLHYKGEVPAPDELFGVEDALREKTDGPS